MPDRIIRDELLDSSRWVGLKDNADRLAYIALLLKADAHGNFTADPWRLRRLWSDFGITSEPAVAKTLSELIEHDLVRLYEHDGTRYLHIPRYRQRLRYTARCNPRSPWCDDKEKQDDSGNSPGDSQATDRRPPGAHRRRKEGSEGSEGRKEVRAPVDNSAPKDADKPFAYAKKTNGKDGWWSTDAGIEAKAREVGVNTHGLSRDAAIQKVFAAMHKVGT